MIDGKNVTWFPSYGAEMRGGTANCTVVVSSEMIGSPVVKHPDILIALNNASLERFLPRVREGGEVFYDSSLVADPPDGNDISACAVPSSGIAGEIGNPRLSNMVLLGAFVARTRFISEESLRTALEMTVPAHRSALMENNLSAMKKGLELGEFQKS